MGVKAEITHYSAPHWMKSHMRSDMSNIEFLFHRECVARKSHLLRPSRQLRLRRLYWWFRLKWITAKWKVRQMKRHR